MNVYFGCKMDTESHHCCAAVKELKVCGGGQEGVSCSYQAQDLGDFCVNFTFKILVLPS
jgi:hypothetical protein